MPVNSIRSEMVSAISPRTCEFDQPADRLGAEVSRRCARAQASGMERLIAAALSHFH
jgi:hypothetical protein